MYYGCIVPISAYTYNMRALSVLGYVAQLAPLPLLRLCLLCGQLGELSPPRTALLSSLLAMPFFERGPARIYYEEVGSGFPLLVIPGGAHSFAPRFTAAHFTRGTQGGSARRSLGWSRSPRWSAMPPTSA